MRLTPCRGSRVFRGMPSLILSTSWLPFRLSRPAMADAGGRLIGRDQTNKNLVNPRLNSQWSINVREPAHRVAHFLFDALGQFPDLVQLVQLLAGYCTRVIRCDFLVQFPGQLEQFIGV